MDDHYRPVEGYPGYRVSRTGEVQSCWSRHARPVRMTDAWLTLRPITRLGYPSVNLARGGKKTAHRIHRLVLEAFLGPPSEGMVACHGDGDRMNNDIANLRWDTHKGNSEDALRHGTRARGSKANSKLTEVEVLEIRRLGAEGVPRRELAVRFGVSGQNIEAIVNLRSWRHLPGNTSVGDSGNEECPSEVQEWRGMAS